ncbi:hypothetical protein ASE36_15450 [Rhizobium sp. Root274]|uniref:hypothetical protein n=1 Tax=unclassified Rhizobium TaxID=2613769 RepID=UPI00071302C8|nr:MULTISPECIES: hypothetical protein [unclassified Rhizobium]KQW27872.1 hypothetical protein ASC71_15480 [Rhizobium sp. Root1240]KRD28153.1 hypothetical protein ASE36_15450 [Rhizobium sp. Root274]
MRKMRKFSDIPTADFPMNDKTYYRLRAEIGSISARFLNLGTRDGADVAKKMEAVFGALDDAWQAIRRIEAREEQAMAASVNHSLGGCIESEISQ